MTANQEEQPILINVDELAKKKVQEIEEFLDHGSVKDGEFKEFVDWFAILKQIITAADLHRSNDGQNISKNDTNESIYADYSDDNEQFTSQVDLSEQFATNSVKWTIRVKAFKLVHRLIQLMISQRTEQSTTSPVHGPQKLPKKLVSQLPDLVRLSFVAATSPYDELKMQGFEMFRVLIDKFASHADQEFPSHSILEQYKTQFLSAVKPAFNPDAPPYITAIASQICSSWICQGLEKDSADIQRTYQLMLLSVEKLDGQCMNQHSKLYTESELEQERLDILGAWALLYLSSKESDLPDYHGRLSRLSKPECERLRCLVSSQVETLVDKWWDAMKDYALLIMPSPKFLGTSHGNENVYTREVALKLFSSTWPKLLLALSIWLCNDRGGSLDSEDSRKLEDSPKSSIRKTDKTKYCKFLCGIIMKELSRCLVDQTPSNQPLQQSTVMALRSLNMLLSDNLMQGVFLGNLALAQEFYRTLFHINVCHARDPNRLLLRQTLDNLFDLIVSKIVKEERNVKYGISKLVGALISAMKEIKIASKQKSTTDIDVQRSHLSIISKNLLGLVKASPKSFQDEVPLQVALIVVFRELLCFEEDPMVSVTSADRLKDLLPMIEDESIRVHVLEELYPTICEQVSNLIDILFSSKNYSEKDKLHLSRADSLIKSMRLLLEAIRNENRLDKIELYIVSTLRCLESCGDDLDEWISADFKKRRELLEFLINQSVAMRKLCLGADIEARVQETLDSATKLHRNIKTKLESTSQKSINIQKTPNSKPQVAKISLKADFSNFYRN